MTGEREPRITLKQERFAEAIVDGAPSLAEAARIAGYSADDIHEASVQGSRALASVGVQRAIQERRQTLAEQAGIDPKTVLMRVEARAKDADVPHTVRQRADETLIDVLALRDQAAGTIDARSLTINASSADVTELAKLIAGL